MIDWEQGRNLALTGLAAGPLAPVALATGIGGLALGQIRGNRQNTPERLAQQTDLNPEELQKAIAGWDEDQVASFTNARQQTLENQVRAGQKTPQEARALMDQYRFSLDDQASGNGSNSVGYQVSDPKTASQVAGDQSEFLNTYNYSEPNTDMGLPSSQQFTQMADFSQANNNLQNNLLNNDYRSQFGREMDYVRPLERDRNYEQFVIGENQAANANRRQIAGNLIGTYANTTSQLALSGLGR